MYAAAVFLDRGYLTVARFRGAPIRLHWSLLIGLVMVSGLTFDPGRWAGYVLVVLLHELGHAALAKRYGMAVLEVMLHGFGGHCRYAGAPTPWQRAVIASGGVLAQLVILAIALPLSFFLVEGPLTAGLFGALVRTNVILMLFNLVPIAPLDGAEIAKIPGLLRARRLSREVRAARARIEVKAGHRLDLGEVDEAAVEETVRRALDAARRGSGPPAS